MKQNIHTQYHPNAKVTCVCGAEYNIGSTLKEIELEVCANCHPFYTGKGKLVDTAGRVDRFRERAAAQEKIAQMRGSKKTRKTKDVVRKERRAKRVESA